MQDTRSSFLPVAASAFSLVVALAVCMTVVVFSWPDPHDRKRAVAPKLVECCEVRIGSAVLFSRRAERGTVVTALEPAAPIDNRHPGPAEFPDGGRILPAAAR